MSDTLRYYALNPTDFIYLKEAIDARSPLRNLLVPLNTHVVPLFRIFTYRVTRAAVRVEDLPRVPMGIGKESIRRGLGRVLVPGIPQRHSADAAGLLCLPSGDTSQSSEQVRRLLGTYYQNEPSLRPPWPLPAEPWPPAPPDS